MLSDAQPRSDVLDRRFVVKTPEEAIAYSLDLVEQHFHEENPSQIDACMRLYTDDAIWDAPARGVSYKGKELIRKNYLGVFEAAEGIQFFPLERFATADRVVDDMWVTFRVCGPGFENCPYPVGTFVKMRLVHVFHIDDGLISREIGYECWAIDPRPGVSPLDY
ncbi:nuclear transport factor 2 family protein [Sphingomonas sp. YL-JM2C]